MIKNVHTEHCCVLHGCKYGDLDCPVVLGWQEQSYLCEYCSGEGINSFQTIRAINSGMVKVCSKCGMTHNDVTYPEYKKLNDFA